MGKNAVPDAPSAELIRPVDTREKLGPYGSWPFVERRAGKDRRAQPTRVFSRFTFGGQRARGRRRGEASNIYVDRYDRQDVLLAAGVLVLNILDAIFTLLYVVVDKQGREANPIAAFLMNADPDNHFWFLFSKSVVVMCCVLFLVMHKTFKFVRPALFLLLTFYTGLFLYHLYLQMHSKGLFV